MDRAEVFNIRQMVELTGLSEFTIRGWENRYAAFNPNRGETGRREYFKSDVERALLLRELLKRGHKIGIVAKLSNAKLLKLFEQSEAQEPQIQNKMSALIAQAMELIALQKWNELKVLVQKIPTKNSYKLIQEFLIPALSTLATKVAEGLISISQEHVFSSIIKEKIYFALAELETSKAVQKSNKKLRFVLATPEGDFHEIGLLMAHLLIRSHGYTSLYLGPHTPSRDLTETMLRFDASHALIVSTVSKRAGARQDVLAYIHDVQKNIREGVKIMVAGSQVGVLHNDASSPHIPIKSFYKLDEYLQGGRL